MKKQRIKIFGICFSLCLLLTGCWDRIEIEDRDYLITMGIDKDEGEKLYEVTAAIADINNSEKGPVSTVKKMQGDTVYAAIQSSDDTSSKKIYLGFTKAVILGRDILSDPNRLKEVLDVLERTQEINARVVIMAARDSAGKCVETVQQEQEGYGLYIWDYYKNNSGIAPASGKVDLEGLLIQLRRNGNAVIPTLLIEDDRVSFEGSAVLRDYQLIGFLDQQQEQGRLWVFGDAKGAVIQVKYQQANLPLRVVKSDSNITFSAEEHPIACTIQIQAEGVLEGYKMGEASLFETDQMKSLEIRFEEEIKSQIENTLAVLQKEYHCDALDFMGRLKKQNPSLYSAVQPHNQAAFESMTFQVEVDLKISGIGGIK